MNTTTQEIIISEPVKETPVYPVVSPLVALFHSRKFLLLLLDTVISVIAYYHAVDPALIAILQPVVITVIYAIAKEDSAEKSAPQNIFAPGENPVVAPNAQSVITPTTSGSLPIN